MLNPSAPKIENRSNECVRNAAVDNRFIQDLSMADDTGAPEP